MISYSDYIGKHNARETSRELTRLEEAIKTIERLERRLVGLELFAQQMERQARLSKPGLPIRERQCVTVVIAAQFVGISRSSMYELVKSGDVESRLIHGRRVVLVSSLLRLVEKGSVP